MIEELVTNMTKNRLAGMTQKVGREVTGLNGALFVHVAFDPKTLQPCAVTFSHKWRDDSTLDKILVALGDTVTAILQDGFR